MGRSAPLLRAAQWALRALITALKRPQNAFEAVAERAEDGSYVVSYSQYRHLQRKMHYSFAGSAIMIVVAALTIAAYFPHFPGRLAQIVFADEIIVDDDGVECPSRDYASIQTALDNASAGDTVTVCAGTYAETVGAAFDNITLEGREGDTVIITAPDLAVGIYKSGFTLQNVTLNISALGGQNIVIGQDDEVPTDIGNLSISNVKFTTDTDDEAINGIWIRAGVTADEIWVQDSTFTDISSAVIKDDGENLGTVRITNNTFYCLGSLEVGGSMILIQGDVGTVWHIYDNIFAAQSTGTRTGIGMLTNPTVNHTYNAYYNTDNGYVSSAQSGELGLSLGEFDANPGFVDAPNGDYSLKTWSAAIGVGISSGDLGAVDFTGTPSSTITVDASGADFTSVTSALEATSGAAARTISVAAGTYSNEAATMKSNVTIAGAGANSITLSGTGSSPVITASSASDFTVQGVTITGGTHGISITDGSGATIESNTITANSTSSTTAWSSSIAALSYGATAETATSYNSAFMDYQNNCNSGDEIMYYHFSSDTWTVICSDLRTTVPDATEAVMAADGYIDIVLATVDVGGGDNLSTLYLAPSSFTDFATLNAGLAGMGTVEAYIHDAFSKSGNTWTFNGIEDGVNGVTVETAGQGVFLGETTPSLSQTASYYGGIYLDTDQATVSGNTITSNGAGISLAGSSVVSVGSGNTITSNAVGVLLADSSKFDSTEDAITGNTTSNIVHGSSDTSVFTNTDFEYDDTPDKTTITDGTISATYTTRATVAGATSGTVAWTNASGGAAVDAQGSAISAQTITDGVTPYITPQAWSITSSGATLNPLVASATVAGYATSRSSYTLSSQNQEVSITLLLPSDAVYVDGDAGSDITGDGSDSAPFATLTQALTGIESGGTIFATGTFTEQVSVTSTHAGTEGSPTTVAAWPGQDAPVLTATGNDYGFSLAGADYVTISGFTVHGATETNIIASSSDNVTINGCTAYTSGETGIKVTSSSLSSTVSNNTVYGSEEVGIKIDDGSTGSTVSSNTVYDIPDGNCIEAVESDSATFINNVANDCNIGIGSDSSNEVSIINNSIYRIGSFGIYSGGTDIVTKNNIISLGNDDEGAAGIGYLANLGALGAISDYNNIYPGTNDYVAAGIYINPEDEDDLTYTYYSTLEDWQALTDGDANSISADPLFTSTTDGSEDFTLQSGSPSVDAGDPEGECSSEPYASNSNAEACVLDQGAYGNTASGSYIETTTIVVDVFPPLPVEGAAVSLDDSCRALLTWSNPADSDRASIRILRGAGGLPVSGTPYDTLPASATSYLDSNIVPGDEYRYIVRAVDAAGNQTTDEPELLLEPEVPEGLGNLDASSPTGGALLLSFDPILSPHVELDLRYLEGGALYGNNFASGTPYELDPDESLADGMVVMEGLAGDTEYGVAARVTKKGQACLASEVAATTGRTADATPPGAPENPTIIDILRELARQLF